jgi:hypothetical protein
VVIDRLPRNTLDRAAAEDRPIDAARADEPGQALLGKLGHSLDLAPQNIAKKIGDFFYGQGVVQGFMPIAGVAYERPPWLCRAEP